MRRINRLPLPSSTETALKKRQDDADEKRIAGNLDVDACWKNARRTGAFTTVEQKLRTMSGVYERCMFCDHSHGTDIEHFRPKSNFPQSMFVWDNLFWSCTECNRIKLRRFPIDADGHPMLVDPTVDNPWEFLDFDPATGNIVAAFELANNAPSAKGAETVTVFQFDRREALAREYQRSFKNLKSIFEKMLASDAPDAETFLSQLKECDDHGLLGWIFTGAGQNVEPFSTLKRAHKGIWNQCSDAIARHSA